MQSPPKIGNISRLVELRTFTTSAPLLHISFTESAHSKRVHRAITLLAIERGDDWPRTRKMVRAQRSLIVFQEAGWASWKVSDVANEPAIQLRRTTCNTNIDHPSGQ